VDQVGVPLDARLRAIGGFQADRAGHRPEQAQADLADACALALQLHQRLFEADLLLLGLGYLPAPFPAFHRSLKLRLDRRIHLGLLVRKTNHDLADRRQDGGVDANRPPHSRALARCDLSVHQLRRAPFGQFPKGLSGKHGEGGRHPRQIPRAVGHIDRLRRADLRLHAGGGVGIVPGSRRRNGCQNQASQDGVQQLRILPRRGGGRAFAARWKVP